VSTTSGALVRTTTFCWSCGLAEPSSPFCGSCGISTLTPTVRRSAVIGQVFRIRRGLRRRRAIAIQEEPSRAILLLNGSGSVEMTGGQLGSAEPTTYGAGNSLSRAWPLILAAKAVDGGQETAAWSSSALREAARELTKTVDEGRLLAMDALAAGMTNEVEWLPLSASERTWLIAADFAARGNVDQALEHMSRLPFDRYPGKELIVARCWPAVMGGGFDRHMMAEHLAPFRNRSATADLLFRLLTDDVSDLQSLRSGVHGLLDLLRLAPDSHPRRRAESLVESVNHGGVKLGSDISDFGPRASALAALANAKGVGPVPSRVDVPAILRESPSVRDDLFDAGLISPEQLADVPRLEAIALYARIAPSELTDEEVEETGIQEEKARRAFLARDRRKLESLPEGPVRQRFLLLDDLRGGKIDGFEGSSGFLLPAERTTASALAAWLRAGSEPVPPKLIGDPSTWETFGAASGLSLPTAAPRLEEFKVWLELRQSRAALYDWNWTEALERAKACLRVASDEAVRDEALNIVACAHWMMGNDEAAIQALKQALEGMYTDGLQANIGVVAAGLEPHTAAEHLGQLALTAPTLKLRVAAAMRALALWTITRERWETEEDSEELPATLRQALRALVIEPIHIDQFRQIVRLLANWDPEWLKDADSLEESPHGQSIEAELFVALAEALPKFVKVLAAALGRSDAEWLAEERDRMVDSALASLVTDSPTMGAAFFGIEIIRAKVPLEIERRIPLTAFAVAAVADNIDPSRGEPKDEFLDMLISAKNELDSVPEDDGDRVRGPLSYAFERLAAVYGVARIEQYNQVVDAYNRIIARLSGVARWNVNRSVVRDATDPLLRFCDDTVQLMGKLLPYVEDGELRSGLEELRANAQDLGNAIRSLPR
jgi:hypothetical protein